MSYENIIENFIKKNYDEIDSLINNDIIYKTYYNGNNILHISLLNENFELFIYLINKIPKLCSFVNDDNTNSFHLFFDIIYDYLTKNKSRSLYNSFSEYISAVVDIIINNISLINIHVKDNNYISVLEYFVLLSDHALFTELVISLLKKIITNEMSYDINHEINNNNKYDKLLHFVLENKLDFNIVKYLLSSDVNVDVNSCNEKSMSPLLISLKNRLDIKIIQYLLEYGSNVDYSGINDEYLPINISLKYLSNNVTELLLQYKPNLLQRDSNFNIPLHNILLNDNIKNKLNNNIFIYIIENSDLNIQNLNGDTCFFLLCKMNLVEKFIDIIKKNNVIFSLRIKKEKCL